MPPARKWPGGGREFVSRGYFTTFAWSGGENSHGGEYPGRGASAKFRRNLGFLGGRTRLAGSGGGECPPDIPGASGRFTRAPRRSSRGHPSRKRQRSAPILSGIQGMGRAAAEPSFSFIPLEFWRVGRAGAQNGQVSAPFIWRTQAGQATRSHSRHWHSARIPRKVPSQASQVSSRAMSARASGASPGARLCLKAEFLRFGPQGSQ